MNRNTNITGLNYMLREKTHNCCDNGHIGFQDLKCGFLFRINSYICLEARRLVAVTFLLVLDLNRISFISRRLSISHKTWNSEVYC